MLKKFLLLRDPGPIESAAVPSLPPGPAASAPVPAAGAAPSSGALPEPPPAAALVLNGPSPREGELESELELLRDQIRNGEQSGSEIRRLQIRVSELEDELRAAKEALKIPVPSPLPAVPGKKAAAWSPPWQFWDD